MIMLFFGYLVPEILFRVENTGSSVTFFRKSDFDRYDQNEENKYKEINEATNGMSNYRNNFAK